MIVAQHKRTELSLVGVLVVERQSVLARKRAYAVADAVVDVRHETAGMYIQHLVEAVGDVKAKAIRVVNLIQASGSVYRVPGKPLAVGGGELEFVAVLVDMLAAEYGRDLRQGDLAYTREVIHHLLLLVAQLLVVGQDLPLASAAHAVVRALRFGAPVGIRDKPLDTRLHERVFLLCDLQIDYIAGHTVGHETNDVARAALTVWHRDTCNGFAFGTDTGDGDGWYEREILFLHRK